MAGPSPASSTPRVTSWPCQDQRTCRVRIVGPSVVVICEYMAAGGHVPGERRELAERVIPRSYSSTPHALPGPHPSRRIGSRAQGADEEADRPI
jgi:hypothetical protein